MVVCAGWKLVALSHDREGERERGYMSMTHVSTACRSMCSTGERERGYVSMTHVNSIMS